MRGRSGHLGVVGCLSEEFGGQERQREDAPAGVPSQDEDGLDDRFEEEEEEFASDGWD